MPVQRTLSPIDGEVVAERRLASNSELETALELAQVAGDSWRKVPLAERIDRVLCAASLLEGQRDLAAEEITLQMGRPRLDAVHEIDGFAHMARAQAEVAERALATMELPGPTGITRRVERVPVGVVFQMASWNHPYTSVGGVSIPALLAGNAVVLRHSDQTPLCAERLATAFLEAGVPEGVFQALHLTQDRAARVVVDPRVQLVAYAGSVAGAQPILRAIAERAVGSMLQFGGKDPAYVRADADLDAAAEAIVGGVLANAGQSFSAVERIYVHEDRYEAFVERAVTQVERWVLGDPRTPSTTIGPVVRRRNAECIRRQIDEAVGKGARALVGEARWSQIVGGAYVAPQLLVNVDHRMSLMTEPTVGPVGGVQRVASDEEALALMNDSRFGLSASVWTEDVERAIALGARLQTGTVFMNQCDVVDPELAWGGVKESGRGCTLSRLGYEHMTRPKSYHLRQRVY